jgi:uncharacterized protein DUF1841
VLCATRNGPVIYNVALKEGENMAKKPKHEESNPRLKAAFLEVVDNQLTANDPPETRQTLDRLIAQGISLEDAKIYIAQAVCLEVFNVQKHNKPSDQARYVRNLQRLPKEPKE